MREIELDKIYNEDCRDTLKRMPDNSVDCVVTSPPYWGLRNYNVKPSVWGGSPDCIHEWQVERHNLRPHGDDGSGGNLGGTQNNQMQSRIGIILSDLCRRCGAWRGCLGLEPSFELYIEHLIEIFQQIQRILKPKGTLWLNLGDIYAYSGQGWGSKKASYPGYRDKYIWQRPPAYKVEGLKPKDLVGIPWRMAFALQADGWYLRQDIIWYKPNAMPESVKDRCTKAHEYIFLLTKSRRYYFDQLAIAEPYKEKTLTTFGTRSLGHGDGSGLIKSENWHNTAAVRKPKEWRVPCGWDTRPGSHGRFHGNGRADGEAAKNTGDNGRGKGFTGLANKRSVWEVPTQAFHESHFATFPEKLASLCILAGCPDGGIVYDPFMGSGTVGVAALKYDRHFIGSEIKAEYCQIAQKRLRPYLEQVSLSFR